MTKFTRFFTQSGPRAIGPYCTASVTDGAIYCSGVIPVDPSTGKLVEGGIEAQTARVLENLRIIAAELGVSLFDALKTTVFLQNMSDFAAVNALYKDAFAPDYPARSCVAVAALPMGALVEIEVIFAYN
ncbi:MAG: Rid family detoxifying hydrolase [Oscillospiraceae bacterium]|jgi:2-iminobutanoate/2-iminopropanoate deaminase|nr:Rid family detoxifying hydrolase [Oscillospiraceae bacterium]